MKIRKFTGLSKKTRKISDIYSIKIHEKNSVDRRTTVVVSFFEYLPKLVVQVDWPFACKTRQVHFNFEMSGVPHQTNLFLTALYA